jgi:hypothetical protein
MKTAKKTLKLKIFSDQLLPATALRFFGLNFHA